MKWHKGSGIVILAIGFGLMVGVFQQASAARFESTNYTIDASVGNSFGGSGTSTNYSLVSSGGESIIGDGSSGSYKLGSGYIAQLQKSLQLTVQPHGLIAYFPMDEGAGTVAYDQTTNSQNATFQGTPTWSLSGKIGGALQTSDNNSVQTSASPTGFTTGRLTVMAWANASSLATINAVVVAQESNSNDLDGDWQLGQAGGDTALRFTLRLGGTGYSCTHDFGPGGLSTGTWYHLAGTYDGTSVRLYLNGQEACVLAAGAGGDLPTSTNPISIGERASQGSPHWTGLIDEVKVYNRTFSDEEIMTEYSAQNAGIPTGLTLSTIVPGASQTTEMDAVVQTDAPGYSLAASQDQDLSDGSHSIPGVSGSIASPVTWSEGSTKGLGFTLFGTNATSLPGAWSSGNAYAALPGSPTTFYTRTGYSAGAKDYVYMRLRADVASSQVAGDYSNTVTWTGVMTP